MLKPPKKEPLSLNSKMISRVASIFVLFFILGLSIARADSSAITLKDKPEVTWRHEFYSENNYLSREQLLVLGLQHRSDYILPLSIDSSTICGIGVHTGYEIAAPAGLNAQLYDYSFGYVAPGILCRGAFFAAILESRRKFYIEQNRELSASSNRETWDQRAVIAIYDDYEFDFNDQLQLFNQAYAEGVFTSSDNRNMIVAGQNRLGLQWRLQPNRQSLGVYFEPYATSDRNKRFYNNRWELRSGAAWKMQLSQSTSILALLGPVYVSYWDKSADLPQLSDKHWGTRALLVINILLKEGR